MYLKQGGRILVPKPQELVFRTYLALQKNGDYQNSSLLASFIHVRLDRELMSDVSDHFSTVWKMHAQKSFQVPMVLSADFPGNLEKLVPPPLALKEGS